MSTPELHAGTSASPTDRFQRNEVSKGLTVSAPDGGPQSRGLSSTR
jgi:hypothetical protein